MAPLNGLFRFTELNWRHLKLPDTDHLVVAATRQVLSVWRKSHNIDCGSVSTLQIVLMLRLEAFCANLIWLLGVTCLLFFSGSLNGDWVLTWLGDLSKLPEADT